MPLAPLDGCATMYEECIYEYQNFVALGACRPEDCTCRLTTHWFKVLFLHVAQEFYMTKCMLYREGEIDSPFSQRNQRAYCVSICDVQILMQHRSRFFFIFSTRNYLCIRWKRLARRFQWTQKKRAHEILVLPIRSKALICAQSWQSLPLSHTDDLGSCSRWWRRRAKFNRSARL